MTGVQTSAGSNEVIAVNAGEMLKPRPSPALIRRLTQRVAADVFESALTRCELRVGGALRGDALAAVPGWFETA